MFRRTSRSATASAPPSQKGPGAKGRPTPSRKEAEAAARERARLGMDKKKAKKMQRERRTNGNAKVREALRTGDERYLPARDRGPAKRFVRNFVDARISVAEFLLPLLLVIMVFQYSGNAAMVQFGSALMTTTILLIIVDTTWIVFRLKRALRARFEEDDLRGTTFYAVMRIIQLRWLRMPKPQVKLGGAPRSR